MQVFTRSVNYCKWSQCCERLLGSLCMYRWHHSMTGNRKQRPRKKTNSQNTRTKQKQKTGKGVVSPEHSTDDLSHEFQIIAPRQLVHPNMHKARSFPRSPAENIGYFHRTSIATFRLTCSFLQFHASGAIENHSPQGVLKLGSLGVHPVALFPPLYPSSPGCFVFFKVSRWIL